MSTDFNHLWKRLTSSNIPTNSSYPYNLDLLFKNLKKDTNKYPANINDILQLQSSLETESRIKEIRTLRGKKRKISTRPYITHSPQHIILGEKSFTF